MFSKELQYFISNQNKLLKKYQGKFLVIIDESVIGSYDTALEAYKETVKQHKIGSFMIQSCEPGPEAYTAVVSSLCVSVH